MTVDILATFARSPLELCTSLSWVQIVCEFAVIHTMIPFWWRTCTSGLCCFWGLQTISAVSTVSISHKEIIPISVSFRFSFPATMWLLKQTKMSHIREDKTIEWMFGQILHSSQEGCHTTELYETNAAVMIILHPATSLLRSFGQGQQFPQKSNVPQPHCISARCV